MPTYNAGAVADTVIAYQKPITLQQGRGLRDNPLAIAEASSGAPVVQTVWHPYDMTLAGTGDGEIWSFAADGAVAAIETPNFVDGWEYRLELIDVTNLTGPGNLTLAVYYQTSAVYSAEGVLRTFPPSPTGQKTSGYVSINRTFETSSTHAVDHASGGINTTGVAGGGAAFSGVLFFTHSIPQRIGKARLTIDAGTMNGGKVLLMRRKIYG